MIRARDAREIRRGLSIARDVIARRRMRPRDLVSFGHRDAPPMPLWQRAYHHEFSRALRDGRLRPPVHANGGLR
ncbi:hypothetical protein [Microbacterium sp. T32]|uniref:hypothetical protein n=1 Tax=Microbacterium sp. T32 TaxID=1776083 RepID=UPI0007ABC7E4|nr:hypothetical protein [Microbacterium sp. T32]KZE41441.1 hypothetical protein AVW09_02295 [Microbacterium sp. T32]